jgi:hypothetical protein
MASSDVYITEIVSIFLNVVDLECATAMESYKYMVPIKDSFFIKGVVSNCSGVLS